MMLSAPDMWLSLRRRISAFGSPFAEVILQGHGRGVGARQLEFRQNSTLFLDHGNESRVVDLFTGCKPGLKVDHQRADTQGEFDKLTLMRRKSILAAKQIHDLSTARDALAPRSRSTVYSAQIGQGRCCSDGHSIPRRYPKRKLPTI